MYLKQLIEKLNEAYNQYGNLEVLMECHDDVNISSVCYVDESPEETHMPHIRLTDDAESIPEIYGKLPEEMFIKEI